MVLPMNSPGTPISMYFHDVPIDAGNTLAVPCWPWNPSERSEDYLQDLNIAHTKGQDPPESSSLEELIKGLEEEPAPKHTRPFPPIYGEIGLGDVYNSSSSVKGTAAGTGNASSIQTQRSIASGFVEESGTASSLSAENEFPNPKDTITTTTKVLLSDLLSEKYPITLSTSNIGSLDLDGGVDVAEDSHSDLSLQEQHDTQGSPDNGSFDSGDDVATPESPLDASTLSLQECYRDLTSLNVKKFDPKYLENLVSRFRHGVTQKIAHRLSQFKGPFLMSDRVAGSQNWREIRQELKSKLKKSGPDYKFATFRDNVWTIDTTSMSSEEIQSLPLRIANRPVILSYLPPLIGSFPDIPDPLADKPIDPSKNIDDETLDLLFKTYRGVKAACVFLNKTLILCHDGKLDRSAELRRRPNKFGGLEVDYLSTQTEFTSISGSNLFSYNRPHVQRQHVYSVGSKIGISCSNDPVSQMQSRPNSDHAENIRAGLRIRNRGSGEEALTVPLHTVLNQAEDQLSPPGQILPPDQPLPPDPWVNPARYLDDNIDKFLFSFKNQYFGKFLRHFEPQLPPPDPKRANQSWLQHDLALIGLLPTTPQEMPPLVFIGQDGQHVEMEWADPNEKDLLDQEVSLLGFNFSSSPKVGGSSTPSVTGAIVLHPTTECFAVLEGQMIEEYEKVKRDRPKREYLSLKREMLRTYKKSYLWRSNFPTRRDRGGLINNRSALGTISGASGCPLAIRTLTPGGKIKYRILGFQNSEIIRGGYDEPNLEESEWAGAALEARFHTYQCLRLPEELIKNWEIVWNPLSTQQGGNGGIQPQTQSWVEWFKGFWNWNWT